MGRLYYFIVIVFLLLTAGVASATSIVANPATGYSPPISYLASQDTWWHDGGAPTGTTPNDSTDVFPDKNHDVASFTTVVASLALQNSYARQLTAADLFGWVSAPPSYGAIFGNVELGDPENYTTATDHYFPPETAGQPLWVYGDSQSGIVFKDVKDEMLVQFFSDDKNDGFVEVLVDNALIGSFDSWCQGWWYLQVTGMDPATGPHTVELRTSYDFANGHANGSGHVNTLDLNPTSENWLHKMPGDPGYPIPDDFHLFFVDYNNFVVAPEPATMSLMALGLAAGGWWMRRRRN